MEINNRIKKRIMYDILKWKCNLKDYNYSISDDYFFTIYNNRITLSFDTSSYNNLLTLNILFKPDYIYKPKKHKYNTIPSNDIIDFIYDYIGTNYTENINSIKFLTIGELLIYLSYNNIAYCNSIKYHTYTLYIQFTNSICIMIKYSKYNNMIREIKITNDNIANYIFINDNLNFLSININGRALTDEEMFSIITSFTLTDNEYKPSLNIKRKEYKFMRDGYNKVGQVMLFNKDIIGISDAIDFDSNVDIKVRKDTKYEIYLKQDKTNKNAFLSLYDMYYDRDKIFYASSIKYTINVSNGKIIIGDINNIKNNEELLSTLLLGVSESKDGYIVYKKQLIILKVDNNKYDINVIKDDQNQIVSINIHFC